MGFVQPLAFWLAVSIPLILLFYFLKLRRPERPVPSVLLWRQAVADARAASPWQRLRASLLLLLQILLAAVLTLAVARPFLPVAGGAGETLVVLLDVSASMQAADVAPTRFRAAVERVAALIDGLGPRDRMAIVTLAQEPEILAPLTADRAELRRALERAAPTAAPARADEALSLAFSLMEGRDRVSLVVVSDGGWEAPSVQAPAGVRVRYLPVGRSGRNAGIAGFAVRPVDGGWSALVRVANFGREPREMTVEVSAGSRVAGTRTLRVAPGAEGHAVFSGLPAERTYSARLVPGDDYTLDDRAWAVAPGGGRGRVLLVSEGNTFLARALALQSEMEVFWVRPADYPGLPPEASYDLYIFDRFLPPAWPRGNVLAVGPPPASAPLSVGEYQAGGPLSAADPSHPLLRFVAWDEVTVGRARRLALPSGWRAVLGSPSAPLLAVGEEGGRRLAVLTFALQESDLPLRTAFPVLTGNLLDWLAPAGLSLPLQATVGNLVTAQPSPAAGALEVRTPEGERVRLAPPFPPLPFRPQVPGIYTAVETREGGGRERPFAVNAPVEESDIAPRPQLPGTLAQAATGGAGAGLTNAELWPWLGWAALALLLAEWGVYSRAR